MLNSKTIAVVVPAYNEEKQIGRVIETMPDFVDRIIIVDDNSSDNTSGVVQNYIDNSDFNFSKVKVSIKQIEKDFYNEAEMVLQDKNKSEITSLAKSKIINSNYLSDRIILIQQQSNNGNGKAIARGLKFAKDYNIDVVAIMDGDGQMDPKELIDIVSPIVFEGVDYVKGNRLIHRSAWLVIPKVRFIGNSILSILNKLASGYWKISDTQSGYVAMSKKALNSIRLNDLYKSYGWPNDMLVKMNIAFCSIREVEIKPVYMIGEKSKMKLLKVIPTISWLLFKSFFKRLWIKYLFRDFHPLFLLYHFAIILGILWLPYFYKVIFAILYNTHLSFETLFAFTFLGIFGFQSFLFAMWMDIQDNERLYK